MPGGPEGPPSEGRAAPPRIAFPSRYLASGLSFPSYSSAGS